MRTILPAIVILVVALLSITRADEVEVKATPLDNILRRWHEEMGKIQSASCQFERTDTDSVYQTTRTLEGTLLFLKPAFVALEMRDKKTKAIDSKYLCDGKTVYDFDVMRREVRGMDKDSIVSALSYWPLKQIVEPYRSLLLGDALSELKKRYDLKLLEENAWYYFILITPRTRDAAAGLTKARLTLHKGSYLPRQLWLQEPNTNESMFDLLHLDTTARLDRKDFTFTLPPGWHLNSSP